MDVLEPDKAALGARIHEARLAAGYEKRARFAREIGYEPKTLQRLEEGRHVPTLGVLSAVARVARVRLAWLVTGEGPMQTTAAA
jgi:transcriptional regulator with XRE-family HTH domain